jgi:hypothetical protein
MTSPIKTGSKFFNLTKFVFANLNPHQKTMGNNFIHQNRANSPNNLSPLKKTVGFLLVNISPKFHKNDRAHYKREEQCQLWSPSQPSPGGIIRTSHSLFIFACDVSQILHKSQCQRKVSYLVRPPSWSKMCVRLPRR